MSSPKVIKPSFGFRYRLLALESSGRMHISDWVPLTAPEDEAASYLRNKMMNLPFQSYVVYDRDGQILLGFMRPEDVEKFYEAFNLKS